MAGGTVARDIVRTERRQACRFLTSSSSEIVIRTRAIGSESTIPTGGTHLNSCPSHGETDLR
ncbi:hypothetical protein C496_06872 [Natronorubrum tibetense GA33]|uniref:Uncharacterized protein n=1 Tax=Natronorubrum tibetense GA33 TaxID=1114856 RepID=L9W132_9EURY|nr:hypothetical protein C496_06872 [Natronorubrum tibetense GA33]